jgi:hypothetical protein
LEAWVLSVYLNTGPGFKHIELDVSDQAKLRERFPLWLQMHRESAESDEQAQLWLRRGEQLARWCGVDFGTLCGLLMLARERDLRERTWQLASSLGFPQLAGWNSTTSGEHWYTAWCRDGEPVDVDRICTALEIIAQLNRGTASAVISQHRVLAKVVAR